MPAGFAGSYCQLLMLHAQHAGRESARFGHKTTNGGMRARSGCSARHHAPHSFTIQVARTIARPAIRPAAANQSRQGASALPKR
jgi:hypothetical protein